MAPRDYIIHPSEYDLGTVIADIHEIRRLNKQRFEMEQLTAIVHEDEHMLVIGKPSGMAVHGGSGVSFGVIEALRDARRIEEPRIGSQPQGHA